MLITQSCPTLWDSMDYSHVVQHVVGKPLGFSVGGFLQA